MRLTWNLLLNFDSLRGQSLSRKVTFILCFVASLLCIRLLFLFVMLKWGGMSEVRLREGGIEVPYAINLLHYIVLMPILEELVYRLPLRFNIRYIKIALFSALFLELIYLDVDNLISAGYLKLGIRLIIFFSALLIVNNFLNRKNFVMRLERIWVSHFKIVLWVLITLFAIGHFHRFDISSFSEYPIVLFLIVGFIFLGFVFSFVRMKLGILSAIIVHSFNNMIPYFISPFMMFLWT